MHVKQISNNWKSKSNNNTKQIRNYRRFTCCTQQWLSEKLITLAVIKFIKAITGGWLVRSSVPDNSFLAIGHPKYQECLGPNLGRGVFDVTANEDMYGIYLL